MDLRAARRHAVASGASDVHFKFGQPPVLRHDGELAPSTEFPPLSDAELLAVPDFGVVEQRGRRRHRQPVNFQGALYVGNDSDMDNSPAITRSTTILNSAFIHAPPLPIENMLGMPTATQNVTTVDAVVGSYSG